MVQRFSGSEVQKRGRPTRPPARAGISFLFTGRKTPSPRVVILTGKQWNPSIYHEARRRKLSGVILKSTPIDEFHIAIRNVLQCGFYISSELTKIFRDNAPDPMDTLTARERTVLTMMAQGIPIKSISDKLFLSPRTIETHRYNLCKKLGNPNRAQLIAFALQKELIDRVR